MTFTVSINGHDDLSGEEKEQFENGLVDKVRALVSEMAQADGINVTSAQVTTNTTGQIDVNA
jgi:hypothetical protein